MICLCHYVHTCTNGAKAMAGKTSGSVPLAGSKRVVTTVVESHCILHYHVLTLQKKINFT